MSCTVDDLRRIGVIATLRAPSVEVALGAVDALRAGGISAVEVTFTTPDVPEVLRALTERHDDALLLGAGTITEPSQAEVAAQAGAAYLVSPGFDEEVFAAMQATGRLTMAGAFTPSEVMRVRRSGTDVVKLFPGSLGGPALLKALRGPFPDLVCVPTGGVSAHNLAAWLAAGAVAVGAGSELCPPAALKAGDFAQVTQNALQFVAALEDARAIRP